MPDCTNENYEFWQKVYALNKTLPQNERIKAVGVDIQIDYKLAIKHLNALLPQKDSPSSILSVINELKEIYRKNIYEEDTVRDLADELQDKILQDNKNQSIYNEYFGENYFDFILAAKSLTDLFEFIDSPGNGLNKIYDEENYSYLREETAYQNFQLVYPALPKGKYFGQFTRERISQRISKNNMILYFGSLLNGTKSPVQNKVLSFYHNPDLTFDSNEHIITVLDKESANELTLFKIEGKHQPFDGQYFQYAVLVKDLKESELYNIK